MPGWAGSDRRQELPDDWERRRKRVLARDGYRCTERLTHPTGDTERCPSPATDVDHIRPGGDHSYGNLRALCSWHHQKKSSAEGGIARAVQRRRTRQRFRRVETHPGLLG